jgi:hypothetical protein
MALPTSYSEASLADYMEHGILRATGAVLGLVGAAHYAEAVNDVAAALGTTIADATDMPRLRILARREAWRLAMQQAGGDYAYTEDGAQSSRQQIFEHCKAMFDQAVRDLALLDSGGDDDDPDSTAAASRTSVPVRNQAVW